MRDTVNTFRDQAHEEFYHHYLEKCRSHDAYYKALIYCLGIDDNIRNHIQEIYNFSTGCVNTECLKRGWQTGDSRKVLRLAFSLYTDREVSVDDYDSLEERLQECRCYSVPQIMCCSYARYFLEAIKIRYSDYL